MEPANSNLARSVEPLKFKKLEIVAEMEVTVAMPASVDGKKPGDTEIMQSESVKPTELREMNQDDPEKAGDMKEIPSEPMVLTSIDEPMPNSKIMNPTFSMLAAPFVDMKPGNTIAEQMQMELGVSAPSDTTKSDGLEAVLYLPQFAGLAPELRDNIWKFTLPGPRTIEVVPNRDNSRFVRPGTTSAYLLSSSRVTALGICRESREVAKKYYKQLEINDLQGKKFLGANINYDEDIIVMHQFAAFATPLNFEFQHVKHIVLLCHPEFMIKMKLTFMRLKQYVVEGQLAAKNMEIESVPPGLKFLFGHRNELFPQLTRVVLATLLSEGSVPYVDRAVKTLSIDDLKTDPDLKIHLPRNRGPTIPELAAMIDKYTGYEYEPFLPDRTTNKKKLLPDWTIALGELDVTDGSTRVPFVNRPGNYPNDPYLLNNMRSAMEARMGYPT